MDDAFGGTPHRPVLYQEIIHALRPTSGGLYVDGTVGAGGHARGILQASSPHGRLLGLDVDGEAISLARQRLASFGSRAILIHASYATLAAQLEALGWPQVNGVLLDLGLSSMQLDTPQRGFSFQAEAPLDMRFDQTKLVTAANLVNTLTESELADILFRYGEERQARQIARAVVNARPLYTTSQLAEIVLRSSTKSSRSAGRDISARGHLHPATRTFQALRIAVNRELESLETALPQAVEALMPGGRLAVIAFHSLEDRIVKQYFRRESRDCLCPPRQPACTCGHHAVLGELTRQPIRPAPQEVQENPRSRSARLRVAEKLAQIDS